MSNGKYTPGPWQVQRQGSFNYLVQSSSGSICSVRCEENADLIAAAPELLEALKRARHDVELTTDFTLLDLIDAAIAKAEGVTQ